MNGPHRFPDGDGTHGVATGTTDAWAALHRALREDQDEADRHAKAHARWAVAQPQPVVPPARRASAQRAYLASVMGLDRPGDLLQALNDGLNPNATGPQRLNLLATACAIGPLRSVQALLAAGADPNRAGAIRPGLTVRTPLEVLVGIDDRQAFDLGKIRALLEYGADPNRMSDGGLLRPLARLVRRAAQERRALRALDLLLDAGADPFAPNREGGCAHDQAEPRLQRRMVQRWHAWERRTLNATADAQGPAHGVARARSRL